MAKSTFSAFNYDFPFHKSRDDDDDFYAMIYQYVIFLQVHAIDEDTKGVIRSRKADRQYNDHK
jgi:hypothetical protein